MHKRQFLQLAGGFVATAGLSVMLPQTVFAKSKGGKDNPRIEATVYRKRKGKSEKVAKITVIPGGNAETLKVRVDTRDTDSYKTVTLTGTPAAFQAWRDNGHYTLTTTEGGRPKTLTGTMVLASGGTYVITTDGGEEATVEPQILGVDDLALVAIVGIVTVGVVAIAAIGAVSGASIEASGSSEGVSVEVNGGGDSEGFMADPACDKPGIVC